MLTLSLILATALSQHAPPPPPPPGGGEERYVFVNTDSPTSRDADGDGFVSREEFLAPAASAFARLDKDGDGRLSDEERASGGGAFRFQRHEDGGSEHRIEVITTEGGAAPRIMTRRAGPGDEAEAVRWVRADGDQGGGDRRVVRIERHGDVAPRVIINGREVTGDEAGVIVREIEGPEGGRIVMSRGDGPTTAMFDGDGDRHIFVRRVGGPGDPAMDKDGDGRISEEEFLAPMREAFRSMDADHSGALEAGEHGSAHD